jgi:hypothetical protein
MCRSSFSVVESWWCVDLVPLGLCVNTRSVPPFNELILGWELESTHTVTRLLKLINLTCRMFLLQNLNFG